MATDDLLLEIGTEEIPAGFIGKALDTMSTLLATGLDKAGIGYGEISTLGTPRRLVLMVKGLEKSQPDATVEVRGPKIEAAYDADGNPTRALVGFARGQGVAVADLKKVESKKGAHVLAIKSVTGSETIKVLPAILERVIGADLFKKSMRWGAGRTTFARPVHTILALYGGKIVDIEFAGIKSSNETFGHRFLSDGKPITVTGADDYLDALRAASVLVDPTERKTIIIDGLKKCATEAGGTIIPDDGLVEEVSNLVEFPVVLRGSFDDEFLDLPREVTIDAMRSHQRYFCVEDADGKLLPAFLTVANIAAKDPTVVINGNERVLRARLSDAQFYFEKDCNISMDDWVDQLKGVVFQAKLGTSYEKVERFAELASAIGGLVGCEPNKLTRASWLAKADLASGMVMEFPKLQGIMGAKYAKLAGEPEEVCTAISEHYMPIAAGAALPSTIEGAIVSISDKMDTIAGCFGVGLIPTGTKDPYALRRAALGIIAIMLERKEISKYVPLGSLIIMAFASGLEGKLKEVKARDRAEAGPDIVEFFKERFKNLLLSDGLSFDTIDAVLSLDLGYWEDLVDANERIRALEAFKEDPDCSRLVAAFKRVSNILKSAEGDYRPFKKPFPEEFIEDEEKALYEVSEKIAPEIEACKAEHDYEGAFKKLTSLKDTIDAFFDKVMVMADDKQVRENRLNLLNSVSTLYSDIADLSKLSISD